MQIVVDTSKIRRNIRTIKSLLKTRFCAVIKADAYGHGIGIAPYIQSVCDCFLVANYDEATAVSNITNKPIYVLGGDISPFLRDSRPCFIPTVSNVRQAEACINAGRPFSVAVNTGMNRMGAKPSHLSAIKSLCRERDVKPVSCYSHIYGGKTSAPDQAELFDRLTCDEIFMGNRHIFCSVALDMRGGYMFDMVRCGIAMYGFSDYTDTAIQARAKIVNLIRVNKGEHIGYGETKADKDMTVAVVSCGYDDGVRRCSGLYMTVRGVKCPVIGFPCMDLTMIDVSKVGTRLGDFAYFISDKSDVYHIADAYHTIVYEVLTGLNGRNERIYR